jgi:hydrogenase nickel incorporation protein HypA/HybF
VHELGVAEDIVETVAARLPGARIARVVVRVGRLVCVELEAIRLCFAACAAGTSLEGAQLDLEEVPGRARCRACGAEDVELDPRIPLCRCGSADLELVAGAELEVAAVEIA